jgi:hypothetical protein
MNPFLAPTHATTQKTKHIRVIDQDFATRNFIHVFPVSRTFY